MTPACPWCEEPILEGDETRQLRHFDVDGATTHTWHRECVARCIFGSVGHQLDPGSTDRDPIDMTRRQAARAALELRETIASGRVPRGPRGDA